MSDSESFKTDSKFQALEYFPFGLSRSGEFTFAQAELLENHGKAYQALHKGEREPVNDEEQRFVSVCQGKLEAETAHEKVWFRFCEKTSHKRTIVTLGSGTKSKVSSLGATQSDDDY